jgi:hypothetical protein
MKITFWLGSTDQGRIPVSRVTDNLHTGLTLPVIEMHGQSALDLSGKQLAALPESLGNVRHLRYLDVHANKLRSLPMRIGALPHLEKLDVRWNKLSSCPEWMQRLAQRGCTVLV